MKIVSIDIETSGLDENNSQILSLGAVIEDTLSDVEVENLPSYYRRVSFDTLKGEIFAINMNKELITEIFENKDNKNIDIENLADDFTLWLNYYLPNEKITIAGKNFAGFDKKFLDKINFFSRIKHHYTYLDPAPLYFNPITDEKLPSLDDCLKRAKIEKQVSHNALEDAQDVVRVLRYAFKNQ